MIKEVALDPQLVSGWDRFRLLTDHFGIPLGRVIAEYPSGWRKLVVEHLKTLQLPDVEQKRIVERMASESFRRSLCQREGSRFDASAEWIVNALNEHARRVFSLIVASSNPAKNSDVLLPDDLDGNHPRWRIINSASVSRKASAMADIVQPLLSIAREIVFVDPYFRPWLPRFVGPLQAWLKMLKPQRIRSIEYQVSDRIVRSKRDVSVPEFLHDCKNLLPRAVPPGICLKMSVWNGDLMHNRFILTDVGGISFGHGLDEGAEEETDEVVLLSSDIWLKRWSECHRQGAAGPIAHEYVSKLFPNR